MCVFAYKVMEAEIHDLENMQILRRIQDTENTDVWQPYPSRFWSPSFANCIKEAVHLFVSALSGLSYTPYPLCLLNFPFYKMATPILC